MQRTLHFMLIQAEFQKIMLLSGYLSTIAPFPNTGEKIVVMLPAHVLAHSHHLACCRIHGIWEECGVIYWKWTRLKVLKRYESRNIDPLPMQTLCKHTYCAHDNGPLKDVHFSGTPDLSIAAFIGLLIETPRNGRNSFCISHPLLRILVPWLLW